MYYPDYSSSQQPLGRPPRPPRSSSSLSSGSGDSGFLPTSLSQGLTSGSSSPPPTAVAHHHINQLLLQETANLLALNAHLRRENERALSGAKMAAGTVPGMEFGRQTMAVAGVAFTCPPPILTTPNRHPGGGMLLTRSASSGSSGKKSPKPESYKTVMCAAWLESRTCVFAENCRFAHGEVELRPAKQVIRPNNKYRTKLCDKFTTTGLCPYGTRCLFIHPETGPNANAYIRSDKMVEINQRLAQASETRENVAPMLESVPKTMVNIQTTPLTSRSMLRPHPSWPLETPQFYRGTLQPENPTVEAPKSLLDYCSETESGARTPSSGGYCSGGEVTPESTGDASPFSTGSSAGLGTLEGLTFSSLDPFSVAIGNDNIAREMAKCLNPW